MNVLAELNAMWGEPRDLACLTDAKSHEPRNPAVSVDVSPRGENRLPELTHGVQNPLPYFETAFRTVTDGMEAYCRNRGISRAEFITQVGEEDPDGIETFWRLFEAVNCDVYGRWCEGRLTVKELHQFCRNVDHWVDCARSLFGTDPITNKAEKGMANG